MIEVYMTPLFLHLLLKGKLKENGTLLNTMKMRMISETNIPLTKTRMAQRSFPINFTARLVLET